MFLNGTVYFIFRLFIDSVSNATDFHMLILYLCKIFLLDLVVFLKMSSPWGFLCRRSCNLQIEIPSFAVWMHFISFFCLIALARTSTTMKNRSSKSRHPCFVFKLVKQVFILSLISMMLPVVSLWMMLIRLRKCLFLPSSLSVITECCYILLYTFSASMKWSCGFCPLLY